MNDHESDPKNNNLEIATEELRQTATPDFPLQRITMAFEQRLSEITESPLTRSTVSPSQLQLHQQRKNRVMKIFRISSLAATVMIIVTGVVFFGRTSQNSVLAFDQVLENAKKAISVLSTHKNQFFGKEQITTTYASGDWERTEMPYGLTRIKNIKTGEFYSIDSRTKIITKGKVEVNPKKSRGFLEAYTSVTKGKRVKYVGEMELNGRTTQLYSLPTPKNKEAVFQMWVDPKTHLPIKINCMQEANNPFGDGESGVINETIEFKWNEPINDELFQLPDEKGYKVVNVPEGVEKGAYTRKAPNKKEDDSK